MPTAPPAEGIRRRRAAAYENPRPEVQALVPRSARRILDAGCSSGAVGAALKARQGAHVTGVELDRAYARDAAARLDRVVCGDLEDPALGLEALGSFDCLLAADVLEHLRDPWRTLARLVAVLEPGGTAVISLPNVRHWETFSALALKGVWPVRESGIFDRTHLRWFTGHDAVALMGGAGLTVTEIAPQYRVRPNARRSFRLPRAAERIPGTPFLVFQYVLAGVRHGA